MVQKHIFRASPIILFLLIIGTTVLAEATDIITFKSTDTTKDGNPLMLTGKLMKPQGDGKFPAIVLLHGCGGPVSNLDLWANRLVSWGYVILGVNSFGPRGLSSICKDDYLFSNLIPNRVKDAYDAKSYLAGLPFVDPNRIALIGWSHGGWTTIEVVAQKRNDPFRSAIAFYPYCARKLFNFNAPLLILIGELDDWMPAISCSSQMLSRRAEPEIILKIYPDSHHDFDWEGCDMQVAGHRLLYNPAASADAINQVKTFLTKHFQ